MVTNCTLAFRRRKKLSASPKTKRETFKHEQFYKKRFFISVLKSVFIYSREKKNRFYLRKMDKSPPSSGGTSDNRMEPLLVSQDDAVPGRSSWRLDVKEFRLTQQSTATIADHDNGRRRFALRRLCTPSKPSVHLYYCYPSFSMCLFCPHLKCS